MSLSMGSKIGIITFHRAINYGAVLQTYALWKSLTALGKNVEVIDYRNKHIEHSYRVTWGMRKSLKSFISWLPTIFPRNKKKRHFRAFLSANAKLSAPCDSTDIRSVGERYDSVITGSDQVFNPPLSGNDAAYFCDFADDRSKRYSYAASLGNYQFGSGENSDRFVALLNKFEALSIREASSLSIVSSVSKVPTRVDPDPTMLLSASDWESLLPRERARRGRYIFIYSVHPIAHSVDIAKHIKAVYGDVEIVHLHNRIKDNKRECDGVVQLHCPSPAEFLHLIRDADLVFTNSFHGTVFSILFNTPFYSEIVTSGGFNNRIWKLLDDMGLLDRSVEKLLLTSETPSRESWAVDWKAVNDALCDSRVDSIRYLESI